MEVKYPQVQVQLSGEDGNAGLIMGRVTRAMKRAGISTAEQDAYRMEAMKGSYDELIQTTMRWVTVL